MTYRTHAFAPGAVVLAASLILAGWLALHVSHEAAWSPDSWVPENVVHMASAAAAYSIGLFLCFRIAQEHRRGGLRRAWTFFCVFSSVSVARHLLDTRLIELIDPGYWSSPLSSFLREGLAALSLIFLVAGILTMTATFLRLRIGFSLKYIDYVTVAVVVSVLASILSLRSNLPTANLESPIPMWTQYFSQLLLVFGASGSILLIRLSEQMGGGRLAITMRLIIAHIMLRGILVLATVVENHLHWQPFLLQYLLSMSAPWLFTLAASYRLQVVRSAQKQASLWGITGADAAA
jgi:hypothetical protein